MSMTLLNDLIWLLAGVVIGFISWYHPYEPRHKAFQGIELEPLSILDKRAYPEGFVEQVEMIFAEYDQHSVYPTERNTHGSVQNETEA